MNAIEVTGKTLAEAKQLAAEKLGVSLDDLNVTVLEETKSKGLFGAGKVRLRAESTVAAAEPQATPSNAVVEAPSEPQPAAEAVSEPAKAEKKPAARSRAKKSEPEAVAAPAESAEEAEPKEERGERAEVVATQADADALLGILQGLLQAGDLEIAAVTSQVSGRYVTIELDGKDAAFLIGKHGEVLNALQYLMNIIAGRKLANGVRATLDGNHYRQQREVALTKLATNIANEVKARGEEAVLDALPAFERRIVHKALSDFDGISTYSEGEEPNRRVVIAPAD